MPLLPEYSLAGRVALLATSDGDDAPLLAQALAAGGARVFVVARRPDKLDAALTALASSGASGYGGVTANLATADGLRLALEAFDQAFVDAAHPEHPLPDILVNDARSLLARPFLKIDPAEWEEVYARNVRATVNLCREAGLRMLAGGYGRIVNIISGLAERGMINGSAFSVTQAALLALTRSLAVEWGRHNIRVNALGTGWTTAGDIPLEEQRRELLVRYVPLRRRGHPRDLAPLLVYLCSEACDYTTGQPVYVDGGLNARA